MKLTEAVAPQKLYMLAEELIRDEGKTDETNHNAAYLLGSAIAFLHFETSPDPSVDEDMYELIRNAVDAAMFWHDALIGAVNEATRR